MQEILPIFMEKYYRNVNHYLFKWTIEAGIT